ncbi:calcineurin B homologous protein 1-like [Artemia franciscana]|uniref:EF-hand domain-containing protein n=1 Tax=Artemia franciscana TaxID=6661 RepID=A0AA88HHR6_ARTSF|nr:hypothetical protein QYM36_013183 [Artemia franciscana]KAK2709431.1 hypothetical protein QYM36_013183 [Artemia franciscana]KAK2709432.1 hypothetical protein QYM36_013183 [Artemia franciscana]
MGNHTSQLQEEEIAEIQAETGFSSNQIERLYSRFTSLDKGDAGSLSREDFMRIPELAINPLGELIINSFFPENSDTVNFRQFLRILAHFRPITKSKEEGLNSREQKLQFAFNMYDQDHDGYISKDELLSILQMMVGGYISGEQLSCVAERTIFEADSDNDQRISFEEFCNVLAKTDVEKKMSIRFLG